jgi:methyl-accepting chemotaxis protein
MYRMMRKKGKLALVQLRTTLEADNAYLMEVNSQQASAIAEFSSANEELYDLQQDLQKKCEEQSSQIDSMLSANQPVPFNASEWADKTKSLANEAARLKGLAAAFERWHEQMSSLMDQNQDMHAKNEELSAIARHIVIVALNASIEAARVGTAGRGFAVVAQEVKSLANRSQELSNNYSESLHRNDLTTTAAFQDIQASGKLIMAKLSSVEAYANDLQYKISQVAL